MPIELPPIDTRTWDDLRREMIARIPTHTPEWTNFGPSDPGITLLELFAFLGESILYRTNRIPERNRLAFLRLLGQHLQPGTPARALVAFRCGDAVTLPTGFAIQAGKLGFHLDAGLDVLPVETFVCHKQRQPDPTEKVLQAYERLYDVLLADPPAGKRTITLYRTVPLGPDGVPFGTDTDSIDGACWIALLHPKQRDPAETRAELAGHVLTLGLAPEPWRPADAVRTLAVRDAASASASPGLAVDLCVTGTNAWPRWRPLGAAHGCLEAPGVVHFVLPSDPDELVGWRATEVLHEGFADTPPALSDAAFADRVLCWLRVRPLGEVSVRLRWLGINAALATQGERVFGEELGTGTGAPDQRFATARRPLVSGSLRLWVGDRPWGEVDDIGGAPREGSPGSEVFDVDAEAGELRCGNGLAGARPPADARVRASYTVHAGEAGNLGAGAISKQSGHHALKVEQPIPAWGGSAPERVADGERQVARWLQHRDRLVTVEDHRDLVARTPGVVLARVEVLPAFDPRLDDTAAPGCVTVLVIPPAGRRGEPPRPGDTTLRSICEWLEPRRLVTSELVVCGPEYVSIFVSVGVEVAAHTPGSSPAEVLAAVRQAILDTLSPIPGPRGAGWPLGRPVVAAELQVVVASVPGVSQVSEVQIGRAERALSPITMTGLQLPWIAGLAVQLGQPASLASAFQTTSKPVDADVQTVVVPLPAILDECR